MNSTPDPRLTEAHELALTALREITPAETVGEPADYRLEGDGVVSLRFVSTLRGYPGWFWTVTVARVEDAEPTVLEVELLPGEGALVAPEWVPWAVRLAEYQAAQAQAEAERVAAASDSDADDELEADDDELDDEELDDDELDDDEFGDELDDDADDFDDDGSPLLHSGDVDGVDIDELDADELDDDEANVDVELGDDELDVDED